MPVRRSAQERKTFISREAAIDGSRPVASGGSVVGVCRTAVKSANRIELRAAKVGQQLSWLDDALDDAERFAGEMNTHQCGE